MPKKDGRRRWSKKEEQSVDKIEGVHCKIEDEKIWTVQNTASSTQLLNKERELVKSISRSEELTQRT